MTIHLSYDVLIRLVERRASPDEQVRAERHLTRCARCRSEREWLQRIHTHPISPSTSIENERSTTRLRQ